MVKTVEIPDGYQNTPVGIIPIDWEVHNIIENSTIKARIGWQGLTTAEYLEIGDYFLVTGTDFYNGRIKWETCNYVSKERFMQDVNIQVTIGDILITKDGTIGKVAYINDLPKEGTLNSGVFVIRPKGNTYLPLFLYYLFNSFYFNDFLRKLVAGSTINHLYQKDFISFQFPLPALREEQTAIATTLSDIDTLIENLGKLITKKQNIKQGAMQELLTGKRRLAGFNGEWVIKKLGEIAEVVMGQSPKSEFYNFNGIGLPLVQGNADVENRKTIIRVFTSNITKSGRKGSIIMSVRAPVGEISKTTFDCCLGRGVCAISYKNDYLYHYLIYFEKSWTKLSTGSTFDSVNSAQVKNLEIPIPAEDDEQTTIATILNDMDFEIEALEKKLDKYRIIKQGMMQVLLTGKIRLI